MPLMKSKWSGNVVTVQPEHVAERLALGYSIIDGTEPPAPKPETVAVSEPPEPEPGEDVPNVADPKPTEDSTIAEIRAYAKTYGIDLPKRGTKAELLEIIG